MNQDEKRKLENELTVMGLPSLGDANLVPAMADVVNGYPFTGERAEFFCEMLNECEGAQRREMYEAMRPRLSFDVPTLDQCEERIAGRAARMIRSKFLPGSTTAKPVELTLQLVCAGCDKKAEFRGIVIADAVLEGRKAGWGRGPERWKEYCPECRLTAMLPDRPGAEFIRKGPHALDS